PRKRESRKLKNKLDACFRRHDSHVGQFKFFRNSGFSIAEILIALGILVVAMIFIAGVFPVGIHFTQENIDKTTAAIVANEAFAKMKLYSSVVPDDVNGSLSGFSAVQHRDFNDWFIDRTFNYGNPGMFYLIDANAFTYPSEPSIYVGQKKYCWSAICRLTSVDPNLPVDNKCNVQVTVFVCNRGNHSLKYYKADTGEITGLHSYSTNFDNPDDYAEIMNERSDFPQPVRVEVIAVTGVNNEIQIRQSAEKVLINDGDLLVDDYTGEIYRVLERYPQQDNIVLLDKKWHEPDNITEFYMWVVPPAAAPGYTGSDIRLSGKSPCVGIYQKVIRF
ncbi:MAG: hypothetical protein JW804_09385, partial [Sedimentisphaerales bacterium]|nr:hypothetical protein [Sedimentisphaerales bacterium]